MFHTSLSAYQTWQTCQQKYAYTYVERLQQPVKDIAPQRGIFLHEYMEAFYGAIKLGKNADEAHADGLQRLDAHRLECELAASIARKTDDNEKAAAYMETIPQCTDIARRYLAIHGRTDAEQYEVVLVEQRMRVHLVEGVVSTGVVDLVLRDRMTGLLKMVEHKTTKSVPSTGYRLRDFQTSLYAEKLRATVGLKVDLVLWNYIRTVAPEEPRLLKNGTMSRASSMDTTWEVYERGLINAGLNPLDYTDVREKLLPVERSVYFPRHEHVIVVDAERLLHDYAVSSDAMRLAVWKWERHRAQPVRTLSRSCDWCQFVKICEAEIMGGDAEDVIARSFTRGEKRS